MKEKQIWEYLLQPKHISEFLLAHYNSSVKPVGECSFDVHNKEKRKERERERERKREKDIPINQVQPVIDTGKLTVQGATYRLEYSGVTYWNTMPLSRH